jgi:aspartate racemase
MHKLASQVSDAVIIPLLHIADATGAQLVLNKMHTIGLLVDKHDTAAKLYDTTIIHALAAVEGALK